MITGGYSNGRLDSIEILDWDEYKHGSQWILSESKLPIEVCSHTLITFEHKLYLIGGNTLTNFDTIWEGLFNSKSSTVKPGNRGLLGNFQLLQGIPLF